MQRYLRLRQRADFARLRAAGRTWRHPILMMSSIPNELPHNRYGFIIGKRIGNAVTRNRLRRRLRGCLLSLHHTLSQGNDIVIIARPACAALDYHALCAVVGQLIQHANLEKKP